MLAILKIFRFFCVTFFLQYEIPKDSSARYYKKKIKKRLQKKPRRKYQNLSGEEKHKKRQYGRERYKNLSEHGIEKHIMKCGNIKTLHNKRLVLKMLSGWFQLAV